MSGSRRRCLAVGVAAEVKNKLSVVDVVGETVSLKKAGTTLKGLCPFHGEKTPSFVVTPGRDSSPFFGCGRGGERFPCVVVGRGGGGGQPHAPVGADPRGRRVPGAGAARARGGGRRAREEDGSRGRPPLTAP